MQGGVSSSFKFGLDFDMDIYYTKRKYPIEEGAEIDYTYDGKNVKNM
jgi:hypothetical protein